MDFGEFTGVARTHTSEIEIALRLVLATLLGAAIGVEREMRDRPAGLKTHMLTALAAAVFTVITFEIFQFVRGLDPKSSADPIRVIEAVTAGVAFLAAGTIIQSRGRVQGLTTGAGMWMAGAIGVACGGGYYALALMAAALSVAIFVVINRLEERVLSRRDGPDGERG
jgi:putative Mg2+ transporter-C (MgtC) family protein